MTIRMKALVSMVVALASATAMSGCSVETIEEATASDASELTSSTCTPSFSISKSSSGNSEISVLENGVVKPTATHIVLQYNAYYQRALKKQFLEVDWAATAQKPYYLFGRSAFTRLSVGGMEVPLSSALYTTTTPLRYTVRLCKAADPCEGVVLPACPRACSTFPATGSCTSGDLCGNSIGDSCSCEGGTWSCVNHPPLGTGCNSVCR